MQENNEINWNFNSYDKQYLGNLLNLAGFEALQNDKLPEMDIAIKLMEFTNKAWQHSGVNIPSSPDPISIIREAREGSKFRCVEYSIVLQALLSASGITSRVLYLRTEDVETRTSGAGHVVVEAYIHEFGKWVMFDPQMNLYISSGKTPLNAMEIKSNIALNKKLSIHSSNLLLFLLRRLYLKWISKYLAYLVADQVQCYPSQYPRTQYVLKDSSLKMFTKFQGTDINDDLIDVPFENFYPIYN